MARVDKIQMLNDTLDICKKGYRIVNGGKVRNKLSIEEMMEVKVFLPEEIERLKSFSDFPHVHVMGRCGFDCENADSYAVARQRYIDCSYMFDQGDSKEILVLNLANPVHPGGGVRRGTTAQEEDLCRKSSLLLSLESSNADKYYRYNKCLRTYMGSNGIIITPKVEIFKDETGNLLDESVIVAVMTCAAPMITYGLEGMSQNEYETMVYERIQGMLRCAAYMGYKNLVLGAFGCGAFGNDASIVSDLFFRAIKEFDFDGMREKDMFRRIDFAVLSRDPEQYNFQQFYRNFGEGNYYREEDERLHNEVLEEIKATEVNLDKIKGSLIGGAIGDALGYPVEFMTLSEIKEAYGATGITEYQKDSFSGKALISDDTQMTLFTANGILAGDTRLCTRGIGGNPCDYVPMAYQDWLITQEQSYQTGCKTQRYGENCGISWLLDVPELYSRRAPGNSCLSALKARRNNKDGDYLENPMPITSLSTNECNLHYDDLIERIKNICLTLSWDFDKKSLNEWLIILIVEELTKNIPSDFLKKVIKSINYFEMPIDIDIDLYHTVVAVIMTSYIITNSTYLAEAFDYSLISHFYNHNNRNSIFSFQSMLNRGDFNMYHPYINYYIFHELVMKLYQYKLREIEENSELIYWKDKQIMMDIPIYIVVSRDIQFDLYEVNLTK